MGEAKRKALKAQKAVVLDTFGGRIHIERDPGDAVTPLVQLPFFIEFLKVSGLLEAWVTGCPLRYASNNAPDKQAVLSTFLLSILVGHHRYAHITEIREDSVHLSTIIVAGAFVPGLFRARTGTAVPQPLKRGARCDRKLRLARQCERAQESRETRHHHDSICGKRATRSSARPSCALSAMRTGRSPRPLTCSASAAPPCTISSRSTA